MKNTDRIERIPSDADTVWRGDVFGAQLLLAFCRRFPSFRGKGSLYRWIASLCFQGDLPLKSVTGARFRIDAADFIAREIAFEGYYEPQSIALAMKIMGSGGVFVDVGCNVGLYTISVGSLPGVRVVAIDGSFVALARLSQNLKRNPGISAEIVSCALGAGNSVECFELPLHGNLGTTKVVDPTRERSPSRFWVASARLQYLLERFAPCRIRLLKMDVEGSELALFRGLDFGIRVNI